MAVANLDTKKIKAGYQDKDLTKIEETALDGTDGGTFTVTAPEGRYMLIIHNSDASNNENVTIKAPAKPMMGAGTGYPDRTVSVVKSTTVAMMLDGIRYAEADTHKIKITGSADVKVTVVEF